MKPEDVGDDLAEIGRRALFDHIVALPIAAMPTYVGRVRAVLAATLPEHEKQVRAKVAMEMPETCTSCTHLTDFHREDGCWFTVQTGRLDRDLVCPCNVRMARGGS